MNSITYKKISTHPYLNLIVIVKVFQPTHNPQVKVFQPTQTIPDIPATLIWYTRVETSV